MHNSWVTLHGLDSGESIRSLKTVDRVQDDSLAFTVRMAAFQVPDTIGAGRAQAEIADAQEALDSAQLSTFVKPFGPAWGSAYWAKWGTICEALNRLALHPPARILDVGCGTGWTSVFLAEAGYQVTGIDIAPAKLAIAEARARRWSVPVSFHAADMDDFHLGSRFDGALVFDALHHSERPAQVVFNVSRHLELGAWAVFGEPSWLHSVSPYARRTVREHGWVEKGVRVSSLKRYGSAAGLGDFRRFFEGSQPYANRFWEFAWQVGRLAAANIWVAPQSSIWLAARKLA